MDAFRSGGLCTYAEMCRVLRPGGRLLVLEFSQVAEPLRLPRQRPSRSTLLLPGPSRPATSPDRHTWRSVDILTDRPDPGAGQRTAVLIALFGARFFFVRQSARHEPNYLVAD
jgi:hypothetical protein